MKKSMLSNTILYVIKVVSSIIVPLIVFPYITRLFGVDLVGRIDFSNSIVNYLMGIATFGGAMYCIRAVSQCKDEPERLVGVIKELFILQLIATVISYLLLVIILQIPFFSSYALIISIVSINMFLTLIGCEWFFVGKEEYLFITLRHFIIQIISVALILFLVNQQGDYLIYVVILVISAAGSNVINLISLLKRFKLFKKTKLNLSQHMKPMLYLFMVQFLAIIGKNFSNTVLGLLFGDKDVGIFSTGYKVFRISDEFVSAFTLVSFARIATFNIKLEPEKFFEFLNKVTKFLLMLSIPMMIGLIMLSRPVILLMAGDEFSDSISVLSILSIAIIIQTLNKITGHLVLLSQGKEKYFFVATGINVFAALIVGFIFIPLYGPVGAAISFVSGEFAMMIALFMFTRLVEINNTIIKYTLKYLVISILFIPLCLFIRSFSMSNWLEIIISVVSCVGLYGIIVLLTNDFERHFFVQTLKNIFYRMRGKDE